MEFALMFKALDGGDVQPIKWGRENLTSDRSIIVLDESSLTVWLWHGKSQGLIARRTALRQAESLKGYGYTIGKSIVGREIRTIKEIDERKIGKDPETDNTYKEFKEILNKKYQELDNFIITFSTEGYDARLAKPEPEPVATTKAIKSTTISLETHAKTEVTASEYEMKEPLPSVKPATTSKNAPEKLKEIAESPTEEAKVAFIFKAVLDHFDDIWVSKKKDGSYAIEMMDGPVCEFSIREETIKFTANSFSNLSPSIKTEIQKKFVDLSKLL